MKKQYDDKQADKLGALAATKDYEKVCDNADGCFGDGTANDLAETIEDVYDQAGGRTIWQLWMGECRVYYIGTYKQVHKRLSALP